jgi:copper transport protein
VDTAYGRILLVKLAAVAALLALAAMNRFRITPALGRKGREEQRLSLSIRAELMLAFIIFGLVGLWRFTPPPRAIVPAPTPSMIVHLHGDRGMAEVVFQPSPPGPTRATITLRTTDDRPLGAKDVRLLVANRAAGIEPIERAATRGRDDVWRTDALVLPAAGRWQVSVEVLISDFEKVMLDDEIELKP